ncbi:hypothetical protein ABTD08_20145, partial [Acinetobacter baumannii]
MGRFRVDGRYAAETHSFSRQFPPGSPRTLPNPIPRGAFGLQKELGSASMPTELPTERGLRPAGSMELDPSGE